VIAEELLSLWRTSVGQQVVTLQEGARVLSVSQQVTDGVGSSNNFRVRALVCFRQVIINTLLELAEVLTLFTVDGDHVLF